MGLDFFNEQYGYPTGATDSSGDLAGAWQAVNTYKNRRIAVETVAQLAKILKIPASLVRALFAESPPQAGASGAAHAHTRSYPRKKMPYRRKYAAKRRVYRKPAVYRKKRVYAKKRKYAPKKNSATLSAILKAMKYSR